MSSSNEDQNSGSPSPSPPNSSSSPPSSSESPPPPSSSSSPPPSSSKSPPPPSSSSSPPPPSKDDSQSQSPPPPSSKKSPPPPSSSNSKSSPPPPPPPPLDSSRNSSPPPPLSHRSSPSSKSGSSSSSSDQEALIAGVAAGVGLLVIIMIVLLCRCCKKKKRKPHDQMPYYNHNSLGNRNGDYYNGGKNHTNWNNTGNVDPSIQMPLPPSSATSQQWSAVPPLPPPQMHNNEMMSTMGFSTGPHQASLPPPHPSLALGFNKSTFTYEELATATGGFAKENLLGQGGFGYVHKGVLPNGIQIAVKSLKSGSGQGEREFQAEVDIISRVHHRHLVSLVGYCIADAQRMLVYEFVPNDSLEFHLYGKGRTPMDFPTRLKIALGSAKGFAYLHEDCHPRIIHRDIKAANILIDEHFDAKVADFGLAKLSSDNYTHVSTRIMGTFGYLAPEYASSGKLTEKSDVYSYGVVLLELITGRRPVDIRNDDDSLVDWARPILNQAIEGGSYDELVDPSLENGYNPQEMLRMVACAAACIRHSARRRPKMSQIVRALEGDASLDDLITDGVKPSHSSVFGSSGSEYDSSYNLDGKRFKKNALSSQEFTSSEHGVTGEFRVHSSPSSSGDSQEIRSNGIRRPSP